MFRNIFATIFVLVFSQNLFAQKVGVALGFSQMSVEADAGITPQAEGGLLGGALFYNNFSESMMQRIGVLYSQRDFSYKTGASKTNVSLSYLQVPLSIGLVMNPNFAVFGGLNLNLNVGKSCSYDNSTAPCTLSGVKSADLGLNLGINLTFMDNFGLEAFYEKSLGKVMDNTTGASTLGIALLYLIE
jgi:hypothetical protein